MIMLCPNVGTSEMVFVLNYLLHFRTALGNWLCSAFIFLLHQQLPHLPIRPSIDLNTFATFVWNPEYLHVCGMVCVCARASTSTLACCIVPTVHGSSLSHVHKYADKSKWPPIHCPWLPSWMSCSAGAMKSRTRTPLESNKWIIQNLKKW